MIQPRKQLFPVLVLVSIVLLSCQPIPSGMQTDSVQPGAAEQVVPVPQLPAGQAGTVNPGVEELYGTFSYTNEFWPETYAYEHAVMLLEMSGFVGRDFEWEIPAESQVIGLADLDKENNRGSYRLQLPVRPRGTGHDFSKQGQTGSGVQVFAVEYAPNIAHDPFYREDDRYLGWPGYLASITIDRDNQDEVTGGRLLVWSEEEGQEFPSGFGPDGLLFTEDDPLIALPAGYSVVDLDGEPFQFLRDASIELTLYEPADAAITDLSALSYSQAFERLFDLARKEYAFSGIPGKEPQWDQVYVDISAKVNEAERRRSPADYYRALWEFTMAFRDGHVSLDGGSLSNELAREMISSGYGLAVRELDDGRVIVVYVNPQSLAAVVGIQAGAEILTFNNEPVSTAIGRVQVMEPQSTDFGLRYQQARYLMRAPQGTRASITFLNPGTDTPQGATLQSASEFTSFSVTSIFTGYDPDALPVEYQILDSGIGYVRVNSNYDDLNLILRLFERALLTFERNQVPGLIVDLRLNLGGAPLDLAGFLTEEPIFLGQMEYYSDTTGRFEPDGPPSRLHPSKNQFRFLKMALLVDQSCFSACEIEAYAFSQVPGMEVFGFYPTAGVEAETARGKFLLPEGISLRIPTGRFTLPDGSLFLEGVGVEPTVRIPVDERTVFATEDLVLDAAIEHILR